MLRSSSSSMACPVIWGRRYNPLASSSILSWLLRCPPLPYISLLQASFHLRFGRVQPVEASSPSQRNRDGL